MGVLLNSPLTKRGEGVGVVWVVEVVRVAGMIRVLLTLINLLPPMDKERRKMDFLAKSISPNLGVKKLLQ